ncbi:MAG: hypothetical protein HDT13_03220 [Butyrivibrio sp.]|nr:hypothetical protein [Butyrivibrio sp.]
MYIKNREEYCKIPISALNFSTRTFNCLMRANISTLYLLIENIESLGKIHNMGSKSIAEIEELLYVIMEKGVFQLNHTKDEIRKSELAVGERPLLPEEILRRPASDLDVSVRICNCFKKEHIETIGQVLTLNPMDILYLKNMGPLSQQQLLAQIELLYKLGEDYFKPVIISSELDEDVMAEDQFVGKGFDFPVIDKLVEQFEFKTARMAEWFGLSRQGIYNAIDKRSPKRRKIWTGKRLTEGERGILFKLIQDRKFDYSDENVICCCMNDRHNDLACIFVYESEIKCFFLADLPEDLQQIIIDINFHRFSERELLGEAEGDIVYCIKKPYFMPKYPDKFRVNAQLRGLSSDEYAIYLSGYSVGDTRAVNDNQIMAFLQENLIDGKVYISSDPKNQWIRSIASRNGYTIKDFIELYGFESKLDGTELTSDGARERHIEELKKYLVRGNVVYFPTDSRIYRILSTYCYNKAFSLNEYIRTLGFERSTERPELIQDILEQDMMERQSDGKFEDKVFAHYPLLGSKILKQETLDKLNENARKYIDTVLREPLAKMTLRAEMQITLALINNAKSWKNEENSNFWNFISLQFGYRDTNGAVVHLLQTSLENAMKKNHRLFVEDANGRAFKSTAVIHALSTRKSWMALFDFLFDFYKNNLNWKLIPGDPLLKVMIWSLQQKLSGENTEDTELTISFHVYSFQEGIRKLILLRPVFTHKLFERLITKMDALINSEDMPVKTYEEQLCEEWFKDKITAIANTKKTERQVQIGQQDIAIDYSRIRAKLVLKNENDVQLVIPDIRLKSENVSTATLAFYYNGALAYQQSLSWYGNELGKTLNGVSISLPAFNGDTSELDIQVRIICDNKEIYNSDDTMYRHVLIFSGTTETNLSQLKRDNYTLVIPCNVAFEAENADVTEIDTFKVGGLKAYFIELKDGFVLTAGGKLLSFDSVGGKDIRVFPPAESTVLPTVSMEDMEYYFAYRNSYCNIILGNTDFLQQFVILKDGERIEFSELPKTENSSGLAFDCPIEGREGICRIQVINLDNERLVFDRSFILVASATGSFNREFYYSQNDYIGATFTVSIDDFSETVSFTQEDEKVSVPYRNGVLHIAIPKIQIEETSGVWMNGTAPAYYIGNIPQSSLLMVKSPIKTEVRFTVGGKDIMYDGHGVVTLGNVLQSFVRTDTFSLAEIQMLVKGIRQNDCYTLARVCYKERFLKTPEFWTENNRLFWNQGGGFVGKEGRKFTLALYRNKDDLTEFEFDEGIESVEIPADMEIGNYRYEISIIFGSTFKKVKEVIAEGDCIVGDKNLLRFKDKRIVIDTITDGSEHIQIKTCYIDDIEFTGVEDTSEGYCPVYKGVLYTEGYRGERYEFSSYEHTNKRGVEKMMINPVRIVYVGDIVLCITNSEQAGLYYYHYYDKFLEKKVYALTDHEYTKANKHKYSIADLYLYQTERI